MKWMDGCSRSSCCCLSDLQLAGQHCWPAEDVALIVHDTGVLYTYVVNKS